METIYGGIAVLYRIVGDKKEFLLVENGETGYVTFMAGAKEPADRNELETVEREMLEEIGLKAVEVELKPTGVRQEFVFGSHKPERAEHPGSYQVFVVDVTKLADTIKPMKEIKTVKWVSEEKVAESLTFTDLKEVFEKVLKTI
jgi:8-oxo-dGTP pyrophosphatase MutT (NUDIX family)